MKQQDRTNEEKARQIIGEYCKRENCLECGGAYAAENGGCVHFQKLMQMAQWKDAERSLDMAIEGAFQVSAHIEMVGKNEDGTPMYRTFIKLRK